MDNEQMIIENGKLKMENAGLPKGWEMKKLGEICEIRSGRDYKKIINPEGKFPIIGSSGKPMGYTDEYICEAGTTIIGRKGTINSPMIIETNFWNVDTAFGIHALEELDKRFLYFYCLSFDFTKLDKGSGRPSLVKSDLKKVPIPLPPLPEQKRIVSILDRAFEAIDKAKANAEQNLKNAKELFESYLQGVFSNGKLKIENGEWEEKTLGEVSNVEYGFTDKAKDEGDLRYVRITDIDNEGRLIPNAKKYISYSAKAKKFILKNNDLLMARTGATFAKVLLYEDVEPSIFASYLIKIDFIENIDNEFYWYFTKTNSYWEQAERLSSGAAQPHFNGKALKQVHLWYPKNIEEQHKLISEFRKLSAETKKLEAIYQQKIDDLEELKKSILQKAFSGELTMSEP